MKSFLRNIPIRLNISCGRSTQQCCCRFIYGDNSVAAPITSFCPVFSRGGKTSTWQTISSFFQIEIMEPVYVVAGRASAERRSATRNQSLPDREMARLRACAWKRKSNHTLNRVINSRTNSSLTCFCWPGFGIQIRLRSVTWYCCCKLRELFGNEGTSVYSWYWNSSALIHTIGSLKNISHRIAQDKRRSGRRWLTTLIDSIPACFLKSTIFRTWGRQRT